MPSAESSNALVRFGRNMASLFKIRISFMVTFSAAAGYLSRASAVSIDLFFVLLGVMLLSFGAVTLNHIEDARIDRKMARTAQRPIPAGRLSRSSAVFIAIILLLLGAAALTSIPGQETALLALGACAVFWYNVVYFFMKRVSAFAAVPGAVIGALPPLMGWVGAGGAITDPFAVVIASFFFIWQIPHFWLLQITHTDDYRTAGLPTLAATFRQDQLMRITLVWIWATAAGGILLPMLAGTRMPFLVRIAMVLASAWLVAASVKLLQTKSQRPRPFMRSFKEINGYGLFMMLCLCLGIL